MKCCSVWIGIWLPCVCQELPFPALSGVSPPPVLLAPAGQEPQPCQHSPGLPSLGVLARDVWGVMLDSTELCINVETALEKWIWPPARKHSRGKAGPALQAPPVPLQPIPGCWAHRGCLCWAAGSCRRVLGQLSTFSPRCSSAARMLPGKWGRLCFPTQALSSAERGMRRLVLVDFGTWNEDRGVEHPTLVFPILPASDYPHLVFTPPLQGQWVQGSSG